MRDLIFRGDFIRPTAVFARKKLTNFIWNKKGL